MSDENGSDDWSLLEPTPSQRRRIEGRVLSWLEAHETSLASEWLGFVSFRPITALGYVAASALSLAAVTPISWLMASML